MADKIDSPPHRSFSCVMNICLGGLSRFFMLTKLAKRLLTVLFVQVHTKLARQVSSCVKHFLQLQITESVLLAMWVRFEILFSAQPRGRDCPPGSTEELSSQVDPRHNAWTSGVLCGPAPRANVTGSMTSCKSVRMWFVYYSNTIDLVYIVS